MSDPAFSVFRMQKMHSHGDIAGIYAEQARLFDVENADPDRLSDNVWIKRPPDDDAVAAVMAEIGDATVRKNAVIAVMALITASPTYFRPDDVSRSGYWDPDRLKDWRSVMEPWIAKRFPHAVSVVLHLDESSPHYQIIDVPLDEKRRLNCRGKYGGENRGTTLRKWQDDIAQAMEPLGIQRGIKGSTAKNTKVRDWYGQLGRPTPELPPPPDPLPPATFAENLSFGAPAARREEVERQYINQRKKRQRALIEQNEALKAKANLYDLAEKQRKDAIATAAVAQTRADTAERDRDAARAAAREQADRLRSIDPSVVLRDLYGAELERGSHERHQSRKYITASGQKIGVTGPLWVHQSSGKGGKSAIDLVMTLDNVNFKSAIQILSDRFDHGQIARDLTARAEERAAKVVASALDAPPPPHPEPESRHWARVRTWLTSVRQMPGDLVDRLHAAGLVYAGGMANAVFPRLLGGGFLRGTGSSPFKRTLGGKSAGPYVLPGPGDVWLTEGPIDAIAIRSHKPDAHVMALGGSLLKVAEVEPWVPPGRQIVLAFDRDDAGDRRTAEGLAVYPDARIAPPPVPGLDWGASPAEAGRTDPPDEAGRIRAVSEPPRAHSSTRRVLP
jgi:hypothetical protein